jgi:hypothetical protein
MPLRQEKNHTKGVLNSPSPQLFQTLPTLPSPYTVKIVSQLSQMEQNLYIKDLRLLITRNS